MDYARPDRAEALAAQYAAGTLRGAARRRFEALLPGHPALRAALARWDDRLMPLTAAVMPQAPPPRVWERIEQRLWPRTVLPRAPWWQRLAWWQGAAGLTTAAALALAVLALRPPETAAPVIVVLQGAAAAPGGFVASFSGDGRALSTRPLQPVAVADGRALELWTLPREGAPRSLGLIDADGPTVVPRQQLPPGVLGPGTTGLAVSLEPAGGSPTGAPTGPVLYTGRLQL